MASAFEWTRHCFIPLGVSFIKVTRHNVNGWCFIQRPLGLPDLGGWTAMMAMQSIKLFPRLGNKGLLTWHLDWMTPIKTSPGVRRCCFFSKLASSRPKFPKTPTRRSCHTEEFIFKKRSKKMEASSIIQILISHIFFFAFWIVFCQTMETAESERLLPGSEAHNPSTPRHLPTQQRLVLRRAVRKGSRASSTKYPSGYLTHQGRLTNRTWNWWFPKGFS